METLGGEEWREEERRKVGGAAAGSRAQGGTLGEGKLREVHQEREEGGTG